MIINGINLDVDFTDAEILEKIEKGSEKVDEAIKKFEENSENMKRSQVIIEMCTIMKNFLDDIFGEGISDKIFKKKYSLMECAKIYAMVIDEAKSQFNSFSDIAKKYSPERLDR